MASAKADLMTSTLVLVRHGESEWNKLNLFTGWRDVDLTEKGTEEALKAGVLLKAEGLRFDLGFTSALTRAQRTLDIILKETGQIDLTIIRDQALNERDYGDLVGLNKDDARKRWGDEQVHIWRRSYDIAPPGGESLKDTADRVLPYYQARISPELKVGKSVIVAAHGNSLRALVMVLDRLSQEEVLQLNLATGVPLVYRLDGGGAVIEKRELLG
jgi:2,3-bisphosphoglycerate-dependent phosphoglycerate mutase